MTYARLGHEELGREGLGLRLDLRLDLQVRDVVEDVGDPAADLRGLLLLHAARRDGRRAHADTGGLEWGLRVIRNRVLVHNDAGRVERRRRVLARDALRALHVDEEKVVVRTAGDDAVAAVLDRLAHRLAVLDDLLRIALLLRTHPLAEEDRLRRDDVLERTALHAGEDRAVERLRPLLLAEH